MSLVLTKMQDWRVNSPNLDANMTRPSQYGALDFFITETNKPNGILTPELVQKAFASAGNTVKVPVIDYDSSVTVSNSRSCTISDDENTSALYSVSWTTYAVGFTMTPALYMNNDISYEHDFARKMEKVSRALAASLDTAAVAALEAAKTKVIANTLGYTFSSNVVSVADTQKTAIIGSLAPMMASNDYFGKLHIIGEYGTQDIIQQMAQHALYNDVNFALQYQDKVLHFTNRLTNDTDIEATMYAVEEGNVGVLTRVDREALRGTKANDHEWGVTRLPLIDLPVGFHYYTAVGDQSSIASTASADLTCGVKEYFGFSVDAAFVTAYNSDTTNVASPIIKVEVAEPTS